ncbi:G:T/U mismatch-specific uracil/thymine DNA-glycosylase [Lachnospiraceae bacterium KM106-2]|nr:G:T/U mismatch-specific uracil/thymine DNA-glycosylase [Lachnospiraceae bacterium KM106-2]
MYERFEHTCYPIYDENSKILILGTFPSVKSREAKFFYSHPQNRFWKLLARLTESENPTTIEEKKKLLLDHHIALWDVIASCDVEGSADSSIKNVVPADISGILKEADIKMIFANGGKAYELYQKYIYPDSQREIVKLPSTSPANANYQMDRLVESWDIILKYLDNNL